MHLYARRSSGWYGLIAVALACLFVTSFCQAQIEITLKNEFIEKYRNRATIEASFIVDMAHKRPNPPSKDGDMHIAGRDPAIGLATVAEIMNAKFFKPAVDKIHDVEGTEDHVPLAGAWRIWTEQGGLGEQVQGRPLKAFETTNPPHVFEIHPLTLVDTIKLEGSFKPIKGYETKDAETAFISFEKLECEILPGSSTTKLTVDVGKNNYVESKLELNKDPEDLEDGGKKAMCTVMDLEDEIILHNRRMIFVKDTRPEQLIRTRHKGARLHVLGIPRIDLELVHWRTEHSKDRPEILRWRLPYEMIIAGVYEDDAGESDE
jgi:hypothetical protein